MTKHQKGFGIIALIILIAVIFALLNLYSYYNPNFSLAKYSIANYFKNLHDEQRKKDLAALQKAVEKYYEENGTYPATVGFCGRIVNLIHAEAVNALTAYFPKNEFPEDPSFKGTGKDYFYARTESGYVLMAVLEVPPKIPEDEADLYNFPNCYDWPGDNVFNYRLEGTGH